MIIPSYKPAFVYGGPVRSVACLCENLAKRGHDVTVYTTNANGRENLPVHISKPINVSGVKVYYFKRRTKDHSNYTPGLLGKLNETAQDFDVVHIHSWWNLVTMPSVQICLQKGIRPAFSPRGSLAGYTFTHKNLRIKSILHRFFGKTLLQKCIFLASTPKEANEVDQAVGRTTIKVLPNMLDLPSKVFAHHASDTFRLIFIGRVAPGKNIELLIQVLNTGFEFPIQLTIIGDGEPSYIRALKQQNSSNHSIEWLGALDGDQKWEHLAQSDLLVLPSLSENFANVVPEALSQGTCVLVSESVGIASYIEKKELGWISDGNPVSWKRKIELIRSDAESRDRIRQIGPAQAHSSFSPESLIPLYENFYFDVVNSQSLKKA